MFRVRVYYENVLTINEIHFVLVSKAKQNHIEFEAMKVLEISNVRL